MRWRHGPRLALPQHGHVEASQRALPVTGSPAAALSCAIASSLRALSMLRVHGARMRPVMVQGCQVLQVFPPAVCRRICRICSTRSRYDAALVACAVCARCAARGACHACKRQPRAWNPDLCAPIRIFNHPWCAPTLPQVFQPFLLGLTSALPRLGAFSFTVPSFPVVATAALASSERRGLCVCEAAKEIRSCTSAIRVGPLWAPCHSACPPQHRIPRQIPSALH
mmetsp:Transcript_52397/g.162007  ORF Transcript_52397/g.162007 Transcript_52397/m.162007 type:complete len:225 (+) Transcript_52397:481-1155(+)